MRWSLPLPEALMVNQPFRRGPRIRWGRLISLLIPFFSNYSTNIKRFAAKLAKFGKAFRNNPPVRSKACFMDDLLQELLTAPSASPHTVHNQMPRFEQGPNNARILHNLF